MLVLPVGLAASSSARASSRSTSAANVNVDGTHERARERQIAAKVDRALRAARDGPCGGNTSRGGF